MVEERWIYEVKCRGSNGNNMLFSYFAHWYRPEDAEEQMNQTEREVDTESLGEPKGEWGRLKSTPKRRTSWDETNSSYLTQVKIVFWFRRRT